ncbi:unnamed protein product [Durusdinium trenchii]|uniref:Uncharacterized protein n=1 Tax=Durusdinium trenchii TaxID=1381693 RepID=A0ABP0JYW5_9DINO
MDFLRPLFFILPLILAELENPSPTPLRVRGNLDRARELQRIAAKVNRETTLPDLVLALTRLGLVEPSLTPAELPKSSDPAALRQAAVEEVKRLEGRANELVDALAVELDIADTLKSLVNRSRYVANITGRAGPCRKRARALTWLEQMRSKLPASEHEKSKLHKLLKTMKPHLKRIQEEAMMGELAHNTTLNLWRESKELEQRQRIEFESALQALNHLNILVKERTSKLQSEVKVKEVTTVHRIYRHTRTHSSTLDITEPFPEGFHKDHPQKKTPCNTETIPLPPVVGAVDPVAIPFRPAKPPSIPLTTTVASTTASSTSTPSSLSSSTKDLEEEPWEPSPDMPRIAIPGTPDPDIDSETHRRFSTTSLKPTWKNSAGINASNSSSSSAPSTQNRPSTRALPRPSAAFPPNSSEGLTVYVMDHTLEEMISERARLGKRLIELEKDIELRERRSTGLLKAQLLADDVAHQLRAASKDHAKAVALVSKQLNATDDRLQSASHFSRSYKRHLGGRAAKARIGEEQTKLHRMEEHTLGLWTNVRSSLGKLLAMKDAFQAQAKTFPPAIS